jgi:arylsulfatase A-like enzyme
VDTPLRADVRTLPEAFRAAGLATAAAVADPHLREYGFDSGFDRYVDDPGHGYLPTILAPLEAAGFAVPGWPDRSDADRVTDAATRLVHELPPTGWFLLVQLDDLAGPVIVSRWDQEAVGRTNRPYPADEYDATLLRVDRAIGRLLDVVPATTRVVVAGDRGLWLGESRPEARSAVLDTPFGGTMFEELLHVPLIFRSPGIRPQRERAAVSVVDVGPTLMRWVGLQVPEGLDGAALGPVFGIAQEERPVIAQSALVGPEQQAILVGLRKVIQYGDGHTPSYDLGVDPAESSVIAPTATQSAPERKLLAKLPPRGAGATVARQPPMFLQMGQITRRMLGGAP